MEPSPPARRPLAGDPKSLTLAVVCLALFMTILDSTVVTLALPSIQRDLVAGISGLQWVADAYVLAFASLLLTGGTVGDRLGRKRLLLAGLMVFTAGSAVCALAGSIAVLVAGRVVQGLGAAAVAPQTLAILANAFPDERERARAFGVWSGVSALALVLGPVVGGVLVGTLGWQSVFALNLPIGAAALLLGSRGLAESADPSRRPVDLPGQLLAVASLGALTWGLIEWGRHGWGLAQMAVLLLALAGLAALLRVEARSAAPMLRLELFRSRTFSACNAVLFLVAFGLYASFFFLSLFLQQAQDYSPPAAGVRFLPAMGAVVAAAPIAGLLASKLGPRLPIVAGTTLTGTSLLALAAVPAAAPYRAWWPLLVVTGVGIGLTMAPANAALVGSAPLPAAATASATAATSQQVGALCGIAVLGTVAAIGFRSMLRGGAGQLGIASPPPGRLVDAALSGGATDPSHAAWAGVDPQALQRLVDHALTGGVHRGLLVAGLGYLTAAVLALRFITGGRVAQDPAAGGPARVSGGS
jgi:DHA2 family methylenomycin A resistance protein-like MFS transporter